MDVFSKFYSKAQPLILNFVKEHHRKLPIEIQNELHNLFGKIILICSDIYKSDILKEKYNLNIDLSTSKPSDTEPSRRFLKRFDPCEICGNNRITHLSHIVPRNEGGTDANENLLSLCANHHYLFDNHQLTKEEWDSINWDKTHASAKEYALSVRYKKHEMYWKYNYSGITKCECGSQEFEIYYTETDPIIREGGIETFPGTATKHLRCKQCSEGYVDSIFKNIEYKWWQEWMAQKEKPIK
jgi:hypothetical protein